MLTIEDLLQRFLLAPSTVRTDSPLQLVSSLDSPAADDDLEAAWPRREPDEVTALWRASRSARLFADSCYGQWGLAILDPFSSKKRTLAERASRPPDIRSDDVVLGEFLGDQELLVFSPSESGVRRILVALPLDPRFEWFGAARSLSEFLAKYFDAGGEKYWEQAGSS
jgi:hypothetical protein